jgi:hypothetical protein
LRFRPSRLPCSVVKVTLLIADAALADPRGMVNALGLGARNLYVPVLPYPVTVTLVSVFQSDKQDRLGMFSFAVSWKAPGKEAVQIVEGGFENAYPKHQTILSTPITMPVLEFGDYELAITVAGCDAAAVAHLRALAPPGGKIKRDGAAKPNG